MPIPPVQEVQQQSHRHENSAEGISGCSGVWWPPPKYRDKEARNQDAYLDADV
jgi:hypothetical protein